MQAITALLIGGALGVWTWPMQQRLTLWQVRRHRARRAAD